MNKIVFYYSNKKFYQFKQKINFYLKKTLQLFKKNNVLIEVYLLSDNEMAKVNYHLHKIEKPTNVLSLVNNVPRPDSKLQVLGEIYLAPDWIKKQNLFTIEYLAVHGVLHILGFDHIKKSDSIKMKSVENKIIKCSLL
ncbi:MAG: rRNA maturation RNase YbeY [Minisyncoccia bacterium]